MGITGLLAKPQLDGRLATAGTAMCRTVPVTSTVASAARSACLTLQRDVSHGLYPCTWTMSQVVSATLDATPWAPRSLTGAYLMEAAATFAIYAENGAGQGPLLQSPGGNLTNYDDNAWVGLDLIRAWRAGGGDADLQRAIEIFSFLRSGTDRQQGDVDHGGLYWQQGNRMRATVSAAGAVQLGLQIHAATGDAAALRWSRSIYSWLTSAMRAPDGTYWDHINADGSFDRHVWSYNQGLMIGNGVLLFRATGDRAYLDEARATADSFLAGNTELRLEDQPVFFNAVFFSNLALLAEDSPSPRYTAALQRYAAVIASRVDPRTGKVPGTMQRACDSELDQAGATAVLLMEAGNQLG